METQDHRMILPYPKGWDGKIKLKQACGPTTIELVLFSLGYIKEILPKPFTVSSTIFEIGAMLPYDMVRSFASLHIDARITQCTHDQISYLRSKINNGDVAVIFTKRGFGHWLAVWGYDQNNFYCFDTSLFSSPGKDGLTKYSNSELLEEWGSLPPLIGPLLQIMGHVLPRLKIAPYTIIEYQAEDFKK